MKLQRDKRKTRTLKGAFWRHSKLFGTAVKNIENKDAKWCILSTFETAERFFLNKDDLLMHSDGIRNYLELQSKRLKSRKINGAF